MYNSPSVKNPRHIPKLVNQESAQMIYEIDLPEIDPDRIARILKDLLAGEIRRDKTNAIHRGFHVTHTPVYNKETNNLFDDIIKEIEDRVLEIHEDCSNHYRTGLSKVVPKVQTFWGVLYQKGDKTDWHVHEDQYCFQSVYYVGVEDDTPIIFKNDGPKGDLSIKPKKGKLVVFNGRTWHMVPEITSDYTRIAFVCNFSYEKVS